MVSVEQAAANALGRWLSSQLAPADVVVDTRWPEANVELPPRIVTILLAGPPDEEALDPIVVGAAPLDATRSLFTWRVAALRQPLQLDIWTRYDLERDDLLARLAKLLRAGMRATLGAFNANPVRHGVVVRLEDGWDGFADCYFAKPSRFDTPDSVQRCEYRATYRGWADVDLTITEASARLATIRLMQRITDGRAVDTTTLTRNGVTHERET